MFGDAAVMPDFGIHLMEAAAAQMLGLRKTFGAVQAVLLDHATTELKAGLSDLEKAAKAGAPSDVVLIGATAFRRSADALANTMKTVSETAQKGLAGR